MSILPILSVKDYDASLKFYTEKLGFDAAMSMDMPGGTKFGMVTLNGQGTTIGIGDDKTAYERGKGVDLMLYPDDFDIDAFYQQVQEREVKIESELKTEYWGDRVFSVLDPDGYRLTFAKTVEQVSMEEASKRIHEQAAQQ